MTHCALSKKNNSKTYLYRRETLLSQCQAAPQITVFY